MIERFRIVPHHRNPMATLAISSHSGEWCKWVDVLDTLRKLTQEIEHLRQNQKIFTTPLDTSKISDIVRCS